MEIPSHRPRRRRLRIYPARDDEGMLQWLQGVVNCVANSSLSKSFWL